MTQKELIDLIHLGHTAYRLQHALNLVIFDLETFKEDWKAELDESYQDNLTGDIAILRMAGETLASQGKQTIEIIRKALGETEE